MRVIIKKWDAVTQWRWKLGKEEEDDEDLCGICRVAYDACCPDCKLPGDDCPLCESLYSSGGAPFANERPNNSPTVFGKCQHIFHMHCILKWINTPSSQQQCPLDRRPWGE